MWHLVSDLCRLAPLPTKPRRIRMNRTFLSQCVACLTATILFLTGCADPVTPEPTDYIVEVNDSTGETSIDTLALVREWPVLMGNHNTDTPPIMRQLEAEQMASEAISYFKGLDAFAGRPLALLDRIQDDEGSQLAATWIMLNLLTLDDEADSVVNDGGAGFGVFDDDSTQNMWKFVELCRPANEQEALIAYAYVAEYQYKLALDGKKGASSAALDVQEFWHVSVVMNKNHFVALLRQITARGLTYKNRFLSSDEFNGAKDDAYERF